MSFSAVQTIVLTLIKLNRKIINNVSLGVCRCMCENVLSFIPKGPQVHTDIRQIK